MAKKTRAEIDIERKLAEVGDDAERADVLARASRFKRSWMELAEGLTGVVRHEAFQRWGFPSFEEYCGKELHLRKGTAEKLVSSFGYLAEHAPQVLDRDGLAEPIPPPDTVAALSRLRGSGEVDPRLFDAIQSEALGSEMSPSSLARRFKEALAGPDAGGEPEPSRKAQAMLSLARRLAELLPEVGDLPDRLATEVEAQLGRLIEFLSAH